MKVRVGFVGGGVISEGHIISLLKNERVEVVGLSDTSQTARDRIAKKFGLRKIISNYENFLSDPCIDLIYICLPHYLHYPVALNSFKAGKHVICEKPMAMNAKESDTMIKESERAGKRLFIAENHRFLPENRKAKDLIDKGEIGKPFLCLSCFIGNEINRMSDSENWKGTKDKSGGGVIIDSGPHLIDTLHYFFGQIESVSTYGGRLAIKTENKEEDTALISFQFKAGIIANVALTFAAKYNSFPKNYRGAGIRYDIYGTKGSLHITNDKKCPLTLIKKEKYEEFTMDDIFPDFSIDMDSHFIDCLLRNKESLVTPEEEREVMRIIDACYKSMEEGRKIKI